MRKLSLRILTAAIVLLLVGVGGVYILRLQHFVIDSRGAIVKDVENMESLFTIDSGVRVSLASNPLILKMTDDDQLTIAYEYRSDELKSAPSERARVAMSDDGLEFVSVDQYNERIVPEAIQLPDGTYKRYVFNSELGVLESERSTDNVSFVREDGARYTIDTGEKTNEHAYGVSTYFVDSKGGVVLLYNSTINNEIVVNRAYAPAATNGMEFILTDENILGGTLEDALYADPHAIVRSNGEIWLIVMNQSRTMHPPASRQGVLYAYQSYDDGKTFDMYGRVIGWDDFNDLDAYSLNDPKLVEFADGTLRVYVAIMISDKTMEDGYRYDLVSVSLKPDSRPWFSSLLFGT